MTFTLEIDDLCNLVVARCDGLVQENEIHEAIELSFVASTLPGGMDRAVRIEPTADLRRLDADALHRIQSHVLRASDGREASPAFRSVLIAPSPFHRPIAELYKAIWDSHELPGVEFWVVASVEEAAAILGLPSSCHLLIRWPATPAREPG